MFHYETRFRIMVCRGCQCYVPDGAITRHLRVRHRETSGPTVSGREVERFFRQFPERITRVQDLAIPTEVVRASEYLRVWQGCYQCQHGSCGWIGRDRRRIQEHCVRAHGWAGPGSRSGRALEGPWRGSIMSQQFHSRGPGSQFFAVRLERAGAARSGDGATAEAVESGAGLRGERRRASGVAGRIIAAVVYWEGRCTVCETADGWWHSLGGMGEACSAGELGQQWVSQFTDGVLGRMDRGGRSCVRCGLPVGLCIPRGPCRSGWGCRFHGIAIGVVGGFLRRGDAVMEGMVRRGLRDSELEGAGGWEGRVLDWLATEVEWEGLAGLRTIRSVQVLYEFHEQRRAREDGDSGWE
jgi:hypothetical protein